MSEVLEERQITGKKSMKKKQAMISLQRMAENGLFLNKNDKKGFLGTA